MEEISQEEYEELLRLAGQAPAAASQPAPKASGGMFGGMFGGGGAAPAKAAPAPAAVKSDWQEIFDETYKAPYWWNEKTGETTWDKPAALNAPAAAPAPPPKKAAAVGRSAGGLISPVRSF